MRKTKSRLCSYRKFKCRLWRFLGPFICYLVGFSSSYAIFQGACCYPVTETQDYLILTLL